MEDDFSCIVYEQGRLCTKYLNQLICQYKSSPNIVAVLTAVLNQLECSEEALARLCDCLDVDTATGDCLTYIGTLVGWPRTHCAAQCKVAFGFACPDDPCENNSILGWCSGDWFCENEAAAVRDYTFVDDELYRQFIKAQILANNSIGTASETLAVAQALFGEEACLGSIEGGVVEIIVPRLLTNEEQSIIELIRRVIPVSIGTAEIEILAGGQPFGWSCPGDDCSPAGWCSGTFATNAVTALC